MSRILLALCLVISGLCAWAQEPDYTRWQIKIETGPGRAMTPFHHMKDCNGDDIYDEIWVAEVSAHRKLNKHVLLGIGTGMYGKIGGANGEVVRAEHTDDFTLFGELTFKGSDEKSVKPFLTIKAGPAFSIKNGPNFGIFGAQGGASFRVGKYVDFNLALDINRALKRSVGHENFRHQTFLGAKAGFTFFLHKVKRTPAAVAPQIIEREIIYRDVPRDVEKVREIERVVEKITKEFTPVPVFFKRDDITILDREMVTIQYLARLMKANPDMKFVINGYADEVTGTVSRNEWLATNRAEKVYNALLKEGVPASQISSKIGHGGVGNMFLDNNELSRCVVIDIVK